MIILHGAQGLLKPSVLRLLLNVQHVPEPEIQEKETNVTLFFKNVGQSLAFGFVFCLVLGRAFFPLVLGWGKAIAASGFWPTGTFRRSGSEKISVEVFVEDTFTIPYSLYFTILDYILYCILYTPAPSKGCLLVVCKYLKGSALLAGSRLGTAMYCTIDTCYIRYSI